MPLTVFTGNPAAVLRAALGKARQALRRTTRDLVVLVPAQFTLQAELDILAAAAPSGSFRVQVLSPAHLYARVFEETGCPAEARIDEQGRVMLLYAAALRLKKSLTVYAGSVARPGFAERAAATLEGFKQAGFTPDTLRAMAEGAEGDALRRKLSDLALLFAAYEEGLDGRFLDGEDEADRAVARMADAPFLRDVQVLVYGFDLVSPTLARTICALAQVSPRVVLALPVQNDDNAPDAYLYQPARRSLARLSALCDAGGVALRRQRIEEAPQAEGTALSYLRRTLFAIPAVPYAGPVRDVQLLMAQNPKDEAELAAALAHRLVRTRGYRYREIAIACMGDAALYESALNRAFEQADVPLFFASGRGADKHALVQFVLTVLRAVSRGYQTADMALYLHSGLIGLESGEADLLVDYIESRGIRGKAWFTPFFRGDEAEIADSEPLRPRVIQPLEALQAKLESAENVRASLGALYDFLSELRVFETLYERRAMLARQGFHMLAMEGAQVEKRFVEALDQLAELLGDETLPIAGLYELLRRSLAAVEVKALPQSGDAVEAGGVQHLKGKRLKALFVLGATDAQAADDETLLDEREQRELAARSGAWLGLTRDDRAAMRRLSLKSLVACAEAYLLVAWPQSDTRGGSMARGAFVDELRARLPGLAARGGVLRDENLDELRLETPGGALVRAPSLARSGIPAATAALHALREMPSPPPHLLQIDAARQARVFSEPIPQALVAQAYGDLSRVSASRLECFAACPFRHFARYALRPAEFAPFELRPRDAGVFYHSALERFVRAEGDALQTLPVEEAIARMDDITTELIGEIARNTLDDGALAALEAQRLRAVARRAASIVTRQFDGSLFRPAHVELNLDDFRVTLSDDADESRGFSGRIDRIDLFETDGRRYLRVIDYKSGKRTLSLLEIYNGLQLQLMIYLIAASKQLGAKPAGAFYFTVGDPVLSTESRDPDEVALARERALRLNGLVLRDETVVRAMAREPERAVANVAFNKDGSLRANGRVLEEAAFDDLMARTLRVASALRAQIRAGDTQIAPAQWRGGSACDNCPYDTLCEIDAALPGAAGRPLGDPEESPQEGA